MNELADLLADPKLEARVAAKAIAYIRNPQGVPLLRLKTRIGDQAPQVISECFSARSHELNRNKHTSVNNPQLGLISNLSY
ncbi:hypothetical protein [Nostoc sp. ChiVER01]|uniref:hypothetical protein n=1 Tax=Nostoc sp. ChiVER01 TaxID=3075382 RepID=UPI002AD499A1|nr:hypothetical protein [Nostoc sp. ChiVER01]MDZ8224990.1 hypothetical protein [Nostoc sp. ChiVER01]